VAGRKPTIAYPDGAARTPRPMKDFKMFAVVNPWPVRDAD
jgi:hypothetical protein